MVLLILVVILLTQVELSQVRAPFFVYDTAKKPDRGESARLGETADIDAPVAKGLNPREAVAVAAAEVDTDKGGHLQQRS